MPRKRKIRPGKIVCIVAPVVVSAGLVFGPASVAAAAGTRSTSADSGAAVATNCTQLRKRLAGAPATLRRVDANVTELRARLAEVRLPVRRTILEQRIERLEQLRSELQSKIAEARAACSTTGNTTT